MKLLRAATIVLACAGSLAAHAQGVPLQGGPGTAGHAPMYYGGGLPVLVDSGPAGGAGTGAGAGLSELNVTARGTGTAPYAGQGTGPDGTIACVYDGSPATAAAYHYLCLSANALGGGLIDYGAAGSASPLPLQFKVNGSLFALPIGTVSAGTANDLAYYASSGTTVDGLASADNGILVTSASGVPSISSTAPSGLTIPNPTLTTPDLGTPSAIDLTNATDLPIATGLTGAGTGVLTALGAATNGAGGLPVLDGGGLVAQSNLPIGTSGATIPLLSTENTWGNYQFFYSSVVHDVSAPTNEKNWEMYTDDAGVFHLAADTDDLSDGNDAFSCTRTGDTPTGCTVYGGIISTGPFQFASASPGVSPTDEEYGSQSAVDSPFKDWHSSGTGNDYDVRFQVTGGSSSVGQGDLYIHAADTFLYNNLQLIGPSAANSPMFLRTATVSGTQSDGYTTLGGVYNGLEYEHVLGDTMSFPVNGLFSGAQVIDEYGGSTMQGNRAAFNAISRLTAATNPSPTNPSNRNYIAVNGFFEADSADNGTSGTPEGAGFAYGGAAILGASATNFLNVTFMEANVSVRTGASVKYKSGIQITDLSDDAVQGSTYDAALSISNQSGAVGWADGILFSVANGGAPMNADGTLIETRGSSTVVNGIDISSYTYTGFALATPGFNVNPSGNVQTNGIVTHNGSGGGTYAHVFNIYWTGSEPDLYIDSGNNGEIMLATPGTVGATCATGSPTPSFATVNGIVTHC